MAAFINSFFPSKKYRRAFWVLIVLYALFGLLFIARSSFTADDGKRYFLLFDDAMISMRYANNLVQGHGLVWNIGEHVEGFTTPLMVFVYAFSIKVFGKIYASLFVQLLGLVCILANLFLLLKIIQALVHKDEPREFLGFLSVFLTVIFYPVVYWTLFGMEDGFLITVFLGIFCLDLYEKPGTKFNWPLALLLATVFMFRPDGALFLLLYFAFRLLRKVRSWPEFWGVVAEGIIVAIPAVAYEIFRLKYYGLWVPNTYILKVTGWPLAFKLKNGAIFTALFLERLALVILPVVLFFFVHIFWAGAKAKEKWREALFGKSAYIYLFVLLFFVYTGYQLAIGGDAWPPYWRMVLPYVPLLFIAFPLLFYRLAVMLKLAPEVFKSLAWFIAIVLLLFMPFDYNYDAVQTRPYQTVSNIYNVNMALAIEQFTKPSATVASFWAGTIPYLTERYSLDPLGKTDAYIARLPVDTAWDVGDHGLLTLPGHNKYDLNYTYVQKQPTFIYYSSNDAGQICVWATKNLDTWCRANYDIISYKGLKFLLKKNSPDVYWDKVTPYIVQN